VKKNAWLSRSKRIVNYLSSGLVNRPEEMGRHIENRTAPEAHFLQLNEQLLKMQYDKSNSL
jgi:hypothetical protein